MFFVVSRSSIYDSTKCVLDGAESFHVMSGYAIKDGIAVVNATIN